MAKERLKLASAANEFFEELDVVEVPCAEFGLEVEVPGCAKSRLESEIFCSASESSKNQNGVGESWAVADLDRPIEGDIGAHARRAQYQLEN